MKSKERTALIALLLGAAAIPAFAGAAHAKGVSGSFTVGSGLYAYDTTSGDEDGIEAIFAGSATLGYALGSNLSMQFDLVGEQVTAEDDAEHYDNLTGIGGHFTYRFNGGLVGLFAGYGGGSATVGDTWSGGWIGVEGQTWINNVTLAGQFAWLSLGDHNGGDNEGLDESAHIYRGVLRYFWTDDIKVEANLGYVEADNALDDSDDADALEWGLSVMGRISDEPLYAGVAFRDGDYDGKTEGDESDAQTVMFSLTYLFGAENLKTHDRSGASLETPTMPMRAAGSISQLD